MAAYRPISSATDSPLPLGEGLGRRVEPVEMVRSMAGQFLKAAAVLIENAVEMMKLTKRQIEVTMFATGVGTLEGLKIGKLAELKSEKDFHQILETVLEDNKELYKRLANL
jgi:hypothetical protein